MTDALTSRLLHKFLLKDAESLSRALSESSRRELRNQAALARQKVESAKVLWSSGQYVEGLRLVQEGLVESLRAAALAGGAWPEAAQDPDSPPLEGDAGDAGWQPVLVRLGATAEELSQVRAALAGPGLAPPELNKDVGIPHRHHCRSAVWVAETALGRIGRLTRTPASIVLWRCVRVALAAALPVAIVAGLLTTRGRITVKASAQYSDPRFVPAHVRDGNPKTEWMLPTRTAGSIDVGFDEQDFTAVKLLNSVNPPHNDRSSKDVRIECLRGTAVVARATHTFAVLTPSPAWVRVPLLCQGVDTLRVRVDTWHRSGGGLAELAWE